jgi:hypothetical protein
VTRNCHLEQATRPNPKTVHDDDDDDKLNFENSILFLINLFQDKEKAR